MASEQTTLGFRNSQRYDLFIRKETAILSCQEKRKTLLTFFKCHVERSSQWPECQQEPGIDTDVSSSFVYILEDILGLGI